MFLLAFWVFPSWRVWTSFLAFVNSQMKRESSTFGLSIALFLCFVVILFWESLRGVGNFLTRLNQQGFCLVQCVRSMKKAEGGRIEQKEFQIESLKCKETIFRISSTGINRLT